MADEELNGTPTKIGRIEGRLKALEDSVADIRIDVKSLVARANREDGAEAAKHRTAKFSIGIIGGAVALGAQIVAQKIGWIK